MSGSRVGWGRRPAKVVEWRRKAKGVRLMVRKSSIGEKPISHRPRRLADWINPTGTRKVHSLVDKVYKRKNLFLAWEKVKANGGSGGVDGVSLKEFEERLDEHIARLHEELKTDTYRLQPVRQHLIPKAGQPGKYRALGIPSIYDRVCQQALLNRLEPIFEPVFDEANFGYRKGRSSKDALGKIWKEIQGGSEWIVDADLEDFFGSEDQEKLMTLVAQRISDGRVLRLIESMLKAGCWVEGRILPTERGTPQGGLCEALHKATHFPRCSAICSWINWIGSLRDGDTDTRDTRTTVTFT